MYPDGTLPTVITSSITDKTQTSAEGGGEVFLEGESSVIEKGICWNTSGNPSTADDLTSNGSGPGSFISSLSELEEETTYHVRAYAINSQGTAYGNEISFTTLQNGQKMIGPEGGELVSEDGIVRMIIPENALAESLIISISQSDDEPPPFAIGTPAGSTYNLEPNGLIFDKPIEIIVSYEDVINDLPDPLNLAVVHYNDTFIDIVPVNIDVSNKEFSFHIQHFSIWIAYHFDQPWAVFNFYWDIKTIYWYLEPPTGETKLTSSLIKQALDTWQNHTSSFVFQEITSPQDRDKANLIIEEVHSLSYGEALLDKFQFIPLLGNNSIFGLTSLQFLSTSPAWDLNHPWKLGEADWGKILICSDAIWDSHAMWQTLVHEVGHFLGIAHTKYNDQCIMNKYLDDYLYNLHEWDIAALYYYYNPNTILYGTITDSRDGVTYKTVKIGTQWWMAENLQATKYCDGTNIPNVTNDTEWRGLITGAYCWYNNDESSYKNIYGALYNWYAASDGRKLCPTGWHIPSISEWYILTNYLGGVSIAGGKMKEVGTNHWQSPNTGATNESGFNGLPNGYCGYNSQFEALGISGGWLSSLDYGGEATETLSLSNKSEMFYASPTNKMTGHAVRCIKD